MATSTFTEQKVGTVCVVTEIEKATGRRSLFAIYEDERQARRGYGDESPDYDVEFDTLPLWRSVMVYKRSEEGQ